MTGSLTQTPPENKPSPDGTDFAYRDALAFVNREWDRVWDTKSSLEQRAITLITASGVLVTLAFGFTAAVAKGQHFSNFTPAERIVLVISLALFASSALIALIVNQPKSYPDPDFRDILGISSTPIEGKPLQRFDIALEEAHLVNDKKALRLTYAFGAQLAAIAALAVVVGMVTA